jgi:hypothetical protein
MYERGRDIAGMRQTERGRKKGGKEAGSGALPRECAEIFKEAPLKWGVKWKSPLEAGCRLAGWLIAPPPLY